MSIREFDKFHSWMLDLPATRGQTWSAVGVAAVAGLGFLAIAPFAGKPLAQLNAFFPSLDAIVFVTDSITAVLPFAQFSMSQARPLLALASGYLFTALVVIPHALTFTGAFSPTGLLGANIQTGSWLFIFWHIGFVFGLLAYALLRNSTQAAPPSKAPNSAIAWSIAICFGVVCACTWLATSGARFLPPLILDRTHISPIVIYPIWFAILTTAVTIILLGMRSKRSELDLWLMVVGLVLIGELAFSGLLPSVRFSVGFYAGRIFSLLTSSIVLIVLLAETTRLYARVVRSNIMLQHERDNKLMNIEAVVSSIAHEVRQPLSAIGANAGAIVSWLKRNPPDFNEIQACVQGVADATQRTSEVFENIRKLFGKPELEKTPLDLNDLVLEVLRTLEIDLWRHAVQTKLYLATEKPVVLGHKGQLQEVLINLIANAIEAMQSNEGPRLLKIQTENTSDNTVGLTIEDNGQGLSEDKIKSMFDAFVSSKPQGMGLGLALSQMIISRHEGQLSASPAKPRGAILRITLPRISPLGP